MRETPVAQESEHGDELAVALARISQLESALQTRIVIEQAKGILRERFGWSIDEAFDVLRYAARSSRTSIHRLAEQVIAEAETPGAVVIAIARGSRVRAAHMVEHAELQAERTRRVRAEVRAQQERRTWDERERAQGRARRHPSAF